MRKLITCLALLGCTLSLNARVVPHPLFSDHCVLQQGRDVPVWGWADAGEEVSVSFRGETVTTTADSDGRWSLRLPTGEAGGPSRMTISGSETEAALQVGDVLVGEVWIASGQSNMERQLGPRPGQKPIINGEAEAAKADYPAFRQFWIPDTTSTVPLETVEAHWVVCTPETAIDFTAVGFFFGRDLLAALDVPVGLINTNWGGTPAEAWTSEEGLAEFPNYLEEIKKLQNPEQYDSKSPEEILEENEDWFRQNDLGSKAGAYWNAPNLAEVENWSTMELPTLWDPLIGDLNGVVWFRREIDLPGSWQEQAAVLNLGPVDDADTTWINGIPVGHTFLWTKDRSYRIPAGVLKPGRNVIAVRVLDTAGGGGIYPSTSMPMTLALEDGSESLSLAGPWKYRIGADLAVIEEPHPFIIKALQNSPTMLYNGMLAPVIPYSIKGVIWYQGESNADRAREYRDLFPAMIADWRSKWGLGDFPFLYVQIAPYKDQPPEIREAQLLTLDRSPNVAMAVTLDIGDAEDIHPANKEPVGERLALAARALAYGEDIVYSGPVYQSMEARGSEAILHFSQVDPGLVIGGAPPLRGFTVAGPDGVFHPARARIEGDTVIVDSPDVDHPSAVRYGWQNVADGNLFNKAGLPASPFRTDVE